MREEFESTRSGLSRTVSRSTFQSRLELPGRPTIPSTTRPFLNTLEQCCRQGARTNSLTRWSTDAPQFCLTVFMVLFNIYIWKRKGRLRLPAGVRLHRPAEHRRSEVIRREHRQAIPRKNPRLLGKIQCRGEPAAASLAVRREIEKIFNEFRHPTCRFLFAEAVMPVLSIDPDDNSRMFELAPVSLWIEDYSEVKALFEQWRAAGVSDIRAFLAANRRPCAAVLRAHPHPQGQPQDPVTVRRPRSRPSEGQSRPGAARRHPQEPYR